MGVVVQAGHDDVDEGGGETFRQRRRDGRTNTTSDLRIDEVRRYIMSSHMNTPKACMSLEVVLDLRAANEQLGRTPRSCRRHPACHPLHDDEGVGRFQAGSE